MTTSNYKSYDLTRYLMSRPPMSHFQPKFPSPYMHARVMEAADGGSFLVGQDSDNPAQGTGKFIQKPKMRQHCSSFLCKLSPTTTNKTKMTPHRCAFDLPSCSGLLPAQEAESQLECDDYVPIDHIVNRECCSCERISRHALIFLVSRRHQKITTGKKLPEDVHSVIMETTLGRFTFYTRENRNFVDFDATPTCPLTDVPLIPNQSMDEIILGARGFYLINGTARSKKFEWHDCSKQSLEFLASGNFFGVPNAVIYMPEVILKKWRRLENFCRALHEAMDSVLEILPEPPSFVIALRNLPEDYSTSIMDSIQMTTTAERLAACVHFYRVLSRKKLIGMDFDNFHMFALMSMGDLTEAHQHFRSPAADSLTLFQTSQDRFMRLLRTYRKAENAGGSVTDTLLRDGLLGPLNANPNNVALVVFQGFLATVARWNCCRVLSRACEVPEEWIKFVVADDDEIYIG